MPVTQGAKPDLRTGYNSAAGQGPPSPISGDLGGQTLVSGVYNSASSIGLTGTVTLNAQGDPDAVFIFQAGSTLTTASGSPGQPDQRRPGVQRLLAGGKLSNSRDRLGVPRIHLGPDGHHA